MNGGDAASAKGTAGTLLPLSLCSSPAVIPAEIHTAPGE